jgi:hypothetical protein
MSATTTPFDATPLTILNVGDLGLVFLHRAHARLLMVEAGQMHVTDAITGLIEPFEELVGPLRCACTRDIVARWERRYPPIRRKPRRVV